MTTWNHSISWSKLELALRCPLALQKTIDKAPGARPTVSYWMDLGKLTQKVFELYFNQRVNLRQGGQSDEVLQGVADRTLASGYRKSLETTFPVGKTDVDLESEVKRHVGKGLQCFRELNVLDYRIDSESKWNALYAGLRTFAYIDFHYQDKSDAFWIWDGKGHQKENADPRQVQYYAMTLMAAGRKIGGGGLIYWEHGVRPIDLSHQALYRFWNDVVGPVKPLFNALKRGTDDFPATPSGEACGKCSWRDTCQFSFFRKPDAIVTDPTEVLLV